MTGGRSGGMENLKRVVRLVNEVDITKDLESGNLSLPIDLTKQGTSEILEVLKGTELPPIKDVFIYGVKEMASEVKHVMDFSLTSVSNDIFLSTGNKGCIKLEHLPKPSIIPNLQRLELKGFIVTKKDVERLILNYPHIPTRVFSDFQISQAYCDDYPEAAATKGLQRMKRFSHEIGWFQEDENMMVSAIVPLIIQI